MKVSSSPGARKWTQTEAWVWEENTNASKDSHCWWWMIKGLLNPWGLSMLGGAFTQIFHPSTTPCRATFGFYLYWSQSWTPLTKQDHHTSGRNGDVEVLLLLLYEMGKYGHICGMLHPTCSHILANYEDNYVLPDLNWFYVEDRLWSTAEQLWILLCTLLQMQFVRWLIP